MDLLNFKTPFYKYGTNSISTSPPPILLHVNNWGLSAHLVIFVHKKYNLRHWKHGHILSQREMQIKGLRETVLEECLTEAVSDIQNFIRNLSARVSSWPFFKLSDKAQLVKGGGQTLLDPGLREMASSLWCLLCVPENRRHLLVPETQDPDLLPPKPGAWTFPFWINERWQGQREGGGFFTVA